jgi:hypothetical protein
MTQDYLQTQKQKELAFRRADLERALATLEERDSADIGLTSLEDVDARLAALRQQTSEKVAAAKSMLGESLLAMARPGSVYANLETKVQSDDFATEILPAGLRDRHQAYVKLCQAAFRDLSVALGKITFAGIRSELHLDSMARFTTASDWLAVSLTVYLDVTDKTLKIKKDLEKSLANLLRDEKSTLTTIKNLADKSLGHTNPKHLDKLAAPQAKLGDIRAKLVSEQLQLQLDLAQQTATVDNLLADLNQAAGEFVLAIDQAQATSRQVDLLTKADFSTPAQLAALLTEQLATFDDALANFLLRDAQARFLGEDISLDQKRSFGDLLREQKQFLIQLLGVYRQTLDQIQTTAARVLAARADFGKDILTFYNEN